MSVDSAILLWSAGRNAGFMQYAAVLEERIYELIEDHHLTTIKSICDHLESQGWRTLTGSKSWAQHNVRAVFRHTVKTGYPELKTALANNKKLVKTG